MAHVTPQAETPVQSGWRWFPLNVGTALAIAVIVSLLAFLATSDGASPVVEADAAPQLGDEGPAPAAALSENTSTTAEEPASQPAVEEPAAPPPTTVAAAAAETVERNGEDAALSSSVVAMASDITDMGPTEIGLVTNFPSADYSWERIEIPAEGSVDVGWLGSLNGGFVAVSPSWDSGNEASGQRLVTSTSADGYVWSTAGSYELPEETWVSRIVSDGERVYAFAESWGYETGENSHFIYTSGDGETWAATELDLGGEDDEHVYIQNAAAGPAGVVLAVSYESYPEEQPALLDFGDLQVELDHMRVIYRLLDADSGEELQTGDMDELFNWGSDGQRVYNPDTGELLVTVPYEIWEESYMYHEGWGGGSPLPIPTNPIETLGSPIFTIEYEGFEIVVDEAAGEYTVTDVETGEQITAGTLNYLYQGPPPRFVDAATGEVLLSVTWDEWYRAEEQSYTYRESEFHDYSTRAAMLVSDDGETWVAESMPARSGGHVSYIVTTPDGFMALWNSYGEYGENRAVWTFANGSWTSTEADYSEIWLHHVAQAENRFLGVGDGPSGSALWSSPNGVDWQSEFAIVPQNDGSYVALTSVAADNNGTVGVLAHREKWSAYDPLVVEKDGYTLTFEDGETMLIVTDASGATVLTIGWQDFDEEGGIDQFSWEDGVTYIDLGNGETVAITDDEAYAAMDSRWTDQGELGISVFLNDGRTWTEAIVDVEGGLSGANQLHMIDGKLIIAGSYWGDGEFYHSGIPSDSMMVIIVGTPISG